MSSHLKYWYLHDHKLFKNLSFSEIDALCILKRFKKSKKSEVIDLPYSEKEKIYFLKHGSVKLIKVMEDGEEILVDVLQKGDMFGELGLGENPNTTTDVIKVVSDEAIICTFSKEKLEEVMLKKPDFALGYIKFIGFNFKKIQNSYKNIFFKDAKTRLILFLISLIEKEESKGNKFVLPHYLTQKDIAQLICTTRQTVISLLGELEKEGWVQYEKKEYSILDVSAFMELKNHLTN